MINVLYTTIQYQELGGGDQQEQEFGDMADSREQGTSVCCQELDIDKEQEFRETQVTTDRGSREKKNI